MKLNLTYKSLFYMLPKQSLNILNDLADRHSYGKLAIDIPLLYPIEVLKILVDLDLIIVNYVNCGSWQMKSGRLTSKGINLINNFSFINWQKRREKYLYKIKYFNINNEIKS